MEKKNGYAPRAGTNVFATIDGKEKGPLYLVQIDADNATLQGEETHIVPVASILRDA